MCNKFSRLYSYALNEDVTVAQIAATEDLFSVLALPISSQTFEELNVVQLIVNDLNVEHAVTNTS
jgi:hypothetical protein